MLVQYEEEIASERYGCIIQHLQEGQQEVARFFSGIYQVHKTKNICYNSRGLTTLRRNFPFVMQWKTTTLWKQSSKVLDFSK